jgi:hypothetical protein
MFSSESKYVGHVISDIKSFLMYNGDGYYDTYACEMGNYITDAQLKSFVFNLKRLPGLEDITINDVEKYILEMKGKKRCAVIQCENNKNFSFHVYVDILLSNVKPVNIHKCDPKEANARFHLGYLLATNGESDEIIEAREKVEEAKKGVENRIQVESKWRAEEKHNKRKAAADPNCIACHGSGRSYWAEGMYGECLACCIHCI